MIALPIVLVAWFGWIGFIGLVGSRLTDDGTPAKIECSTKKLDDSGQRIEKTCVKSPHSLEDK